MTLFDVAKKNIQGNVKNYLIYLLSMIFSVMIYYIFVSLQYSQAIAEGLQSSESLRAVLSQASVILILFTAIFVWGSNAFFTRKRKKEVGLYALLGMRRQTIARMLFYENLIMSLVALILGVFLGTLLSKLFTMILLKLLDNPVRAGFEIHIGAIGQVTLVFAALILITSMQGYRLIYKFKLVELFQAERKGEHAPRISRLAAGLSVILITLGYWTAFKPISTTQGILVNFSIIFIGLGAGTYLLFRSLVIALLQLSSHHKKRYYRGINMIGTSQLLYRIRSNTVMLTTIALLSSLTLCAVSVGYSFFYTQKQSAEEEMPFSYTYAASENGLDATARQLILSDAKHSVIAEIDLSVIATDADLTQFAYHPGNYEPNEVPVKLISASTYNQAASTLSYKERLQPAGRDVVLVRPLYTNLSADEVQGNRISVTTGNEQVSLEVTGVAEGRILPWGYPDLCIVMSDSLFSQLSKSLEASTYKAFKVRGQETTKETATALIKLSGDGSGMATFYQQYRQNVENAGINVFTLGFLGLVFLAATGSIIYFNQLTEAEASKGSYGILRKIGVGRKDIRRSVAKQVLFVFGLPLIVGLVHSIMMLKALAGINLINGLFAVPILLSGGAYLLIYLAYYAFTVKTYYRTVSAQR
ncbi:ABC transporter permease [Paenibacillus sp. PSB04]|uniref:ABC transporter permease n=1 Tax=Paenibacillus sp. PSB04 TaxID=2866810 RepID=UPI0021F1FCA8|nr:ABC transporter permease [Paenibacillus sp. PSB04]UYO03159.1 ABC transporter permease [Paenibacillus sp. PSB04]